jgi:dipeptidyl aminopeptidase/acylaminoacyl peptidase
MFAQALSRAKVPFELHIYEQGPHGIGLADYDEAAGTWSKLCAIWLRKRGW